MKKQKKVNIISSVFISTAIVSVFIAFATIFAELFHPFKDWLKETFYHHWVGKGVLSIVLFFILLIPLTYMRKSPSRDYCFYIMAAFWIVLLSMLSIALFYLYEAFAHV